MQQITLPIKTAHVSLYWLLLHCKTVVSEDKPKEYFLYNTSWGGGWKEQRERRRPWGPEISSDFFLSFFTSSVSSEDPHKGSVSCTITQTHSCSYTLSCGPRGPIDRLRAAWWCQGFHIHCKSCTFYTVTQPNWQDNSREGIWHVSS